MLADPESLRAVAAVSPGVDGGDGYVEIVGEFLHGEQPIERCHVFDLVTEPCQRDAKSTPVGLSIPLSSPATLSSECQ